MANLKSEFIIISPEKQELLIKNTIGDFFKPFYEELKKITEPEEILNGAEAKAFLKISGTTLWHWERKGIIQGYGIEGKKYYKRSEIMAALIKIS